MSNQITPGPWRKGERVSYGGDTHGFPIYFNDDGEQVADYVYTEADADLIVAAPDLLEALESAEMALLGYTHKNEITLSALYKARAAIAKARGEA